MQFRKSFSSILKRIADIFLRIQPFSPKKVSHSIVLKFKTKSQILLLKKFDFIIQRKMCKGGEMQRESTRGWRKKFFVWEKKNHKLSRIFWGLLLLFYFTKNERRNCYTFSKQSKLTNGRPQYQDLTFCVKPPICFPMPSK